MEASLRRGERIEIRGFGSFEIRSYRAYEGRNPRTGTAVSVKPKRLPFFKVGKELKERVNAAGRATPPRMKQASDGGPAAAGTSAVRRRRAPRAAAAPSAVDAGPRPRAVSA